MPWVSGCRFRLRAPLNISVLAISLEVVLRCLTDGLLQNLPFAQVERRGRCSSRGLKEDGLFESYPSTDLLN